MKQKFQIPGKIVSPPPPGERKAPKPEPVVFHIEAEDREDARFQVAHGVIEANARKAFPGKTIKYDVRRMRCVRK